MLGTTTPSELSESILNFCRELDPTQIPVFLSIQPDQKAIKAECFSNVREHIKRHGGSMQLGWIIWETAGIMLEANFHAVWRSSEGELLDVTPQVDDEIRILFLPDSTATISKEQGDLVGMRRMPLVDDPLVREFIRHGEALDAVKVRTQGRLTMADLAEMDDIQMRQIPLIKKLSLKYRGAIGEIRTAPLSFRHSDQSGITHSTVLTPERPVIPRVGRNDLCPCGSGKKYKKCHGA